MKIWVTNLAAGEVCSFRQRSSLARLEVGPPHSPPVGFSVERLKEMGMVGLYRTGRERVRRP